MDFLTLLRVRLKLKKRHIFEWETLIINQRKGWELIKQEYDQQISLQSKEVSVNLRKKKFDRITRLMVRQQEDRLQLLVLHQEEVRLLEAVVETHNKG